MYRFTSKFTKLQPFNHTYTHTQHRTPLYIHRLLYATTITATTATVYTLYTSLTHINNTLLPLSSSSSTWTSFLSLSPSSIIDSLVDSITSIPSYLLHTFIYQIPGITSSRSTSKQSM